MPVMYIPNKDGLKKDKAARGIQCGVEGGIVGLFVIMGFKLQ